MAKILLFSDLHLRSESRDVCVQVLNGVRDTARNLGITQVGFTGDFFHVRYSIPVDIVNVTHEWAKSLKEADLDLIFLPGNHDQVNLEGRHALEVFEADHIKVYTEPTEDEFGAWLPYRKDPEVVQQALDSFSSPVLFAHVPIRGAMMNNLLPDENGLPLEMFEKFDKVLTGHYHKRQVHGNVQYLGSPWQTRGDEWGQEKGFTVYDSDTKEVEFVEKHYGPKFHRLKASELSAYSADISPFDKVRILSDNQEELKKAGHDLANRGLTAFSLEFTGEVIQEQRIKADKQTTLSEYARLYVGDSDTDLDQDRLLREFEGLR